MGLRLKFNLVLIVVFLAGFAVTQAFLPQSVPAHAATETMSALRKTYPDYGYKEATLDPTNPRNRATDWEAVRPLLDIAAGVYPDPLLAAIDAAMAINPEDRPQSMAEFRDALGIRPMGNHPALLTEQPSTGAAPARTGPHTRPPPSVTKMQATIAPTTATTLGVGDTAELERRLARYIGPMANIIAGRARREVAEREALLQRVAEAIDDPGDRAEFIAAARKVRPG